MKVDVCLLICMYLPIKHELKTGCLPGARRRLSPRHCYWRFQSSFDSSDDCHCSGEWTGDALTTIGEYGGGEGLSLLLPPPPFLHTIVVIIVVVRETRSLRGPLLRASSDAAGG
jgi:hypothetical protein